MKSEIEIDIFLNILFYYFIKRKYSDSEFTAINKISGHTKIKNFMCPEILFIP